MKMSSIKYYQTILLYAFPMLQHVASLSLNGQQLRKGAEQGSGQDTGQGQAEVLWNPATAAGLAFLRQPDSGMCSHR